MRRRPFVALLATTMLVGSLMVAMAAAAQADATHPVTAGDFFFEPPQLFAREGDTVLFRNGGTLDHSITAADGSFDSGSLAPGESFGLSLPATGSLIYFCKFHGSPDGSGMAGEIIVNGDAPTVLGGGESNINSALSWSKFGFADGSAPNVLLGRDDVFADSLASGGPQGILGAPLLLTQPNNLTSSVQAELARLGATGVTILGGTSAVSAGVEATLAGLGLTVDRVAGATRFHTAIEVARRFAPNASTAILARAFGDDDPTRAFADSIAAGALSAKSGAPVLLSDTDGLTAATRDYIAASNIQTVIVAGGPAALGEAVEDALAGMGLEVERAAGETRFDTALALHAAASPDSLLDFNTSRAILVDGAPGVASAWASGFPAAVHATNSGAVLLTNGDDLPASTVQILTGERLRNSPEVVCAPNLGSVACSRAATAATATGPLNPATLQAYMFAVDGVAPPAVASEGAAELYPTDDPNTLCFSVDALTLSGPPTAAHVHELATGNAVVDLSAGPSLDGVAHGCDFGVADGVVAAILSSPGDYYVNVHTDANPGGEISGTVFAPSFFLVADMAGTEEPDGGDPMGGGFALVLGDQNDPSRICWFIFSGTSEPADAAHIHAGARGVAGPVLIPLDTPAIPDIPITWGCRDSASDTPSTAAQVALVAAAPDDHYVNVHTASYPAGAIRAQLRMPFGMPDSAAAWPGA